MPDADAGRTLKRFASEEAQREKSAHSLDTICAAIKEAADAKRYYNADPCVAKTVEFWGRAFVSHLRTVTTNLQVSDSRERRNALKAESLFVKFYCRTIAEGRCLAVLPYLVSHLRTYSSISTEVMPKVSQVLLSLNEAPLALKSV